MGNTKQKRQSLRNRHATPISRNTFAYFCFYCNSRLKRKEVTLDHIIARQKGGTLRNENIVCACKDCNNLKSNTKPELWVNKLKQLGISEIRINTYLDFARNKVPPYHKGFDVK